MSMPPLPDELARFTPTEGEHRALKMFVREYGQACREAALLEAHTQCLYVSDATSEGHSALASPSSAAEDCADRIMALRITK